MALVVKAAVKAAMSTGLTVSRTALWKDAYGPDTKDHELGERIGEPVLDAKQTKQSYRAEHGEGPGGFHFAYLEIVVPRGPDRRLAKSPLA